MARLGDSIENLGAATLKRVVVSPADLEALNPNLVGGDIYGGSCALDQNLLWRPLAEAPGHETAVAGLWHIGASTHPGPGLGAGSGYLVAKELTKPPITQRLLAKHPGALVILSLSEISTVGATFAEDVEAYAAAGFDAIGIWEFKLPPDDDANRALLAEHGLRVSVCVPDDPVGAPARDPGHGRPRRPGRSASRRSSASVPASPPTSRNASRASPARSATARKTRESRSSSTACGASQAAARLAGTRIGFEPVHVSQRDEAGFVNSLAGPTPFSRWRVRAEIGILFDTYHVWDDPDVLPWIAANAAASSASTSATGRRSTAATVCFRARASPTPWSSSRRSPPPAGTARSTSRSSRRRSSSGACRSTKPPAAPMPPSPPCADGRAFVLRGISTPDGTTLSA